MEIELLWFEECPNYRDALSMVTELAVELDIPATVRLIEVPDAETGNLLCFPGSPTIRINGRDVDPSFDGCADCMPRCRLYATSKGLRGLPERAWVRDALLAAGPA